MASGLITSWQIEGEKMEAMADILFLGSRITVDGDCSHEIRRRLLLESYDKLRQHIKKQRHHFADKGLSSQSYDFSSSHVWMWELNPKEGWPPKNWCFRTVVLAKTLWESLGQQGDQTRYPKGNQPWIFIGRIDAEAEAPILWPPNVKNWLIEKDPDAGKGWRQKEKRVAEHEMVR